MQYGRTLIRFEFDEVMATSAFNGFKNQICYLNEEPISLLLFSKRVSNETKQNIIDKLQMFKQRETQKIGEQLLKHGKTDFPNTDNVNV